MPKLLMVTTVNGTLHAFLRPMGEHFRARGWQVDAVASDVSAEPDCVAAFDRVFDVPFSRNPLHLSNLWSAPAQLRAIVAREDYDIVHVHTPVAAFVSRMALRKMRRQGRPRVIYTAHGFHFYEGGPRLRGAVYRMLERLAGRWTDYLVVINREDERAAHRYGIVAPDRVRYMPGIGVDTARYAAANVSASDVSRLRVELGLQPEQPMLLMIAEFNPRKRHRDAVEALARLRNKGTCLIFAGGGPLEDETRRLAASRGVADRVRFLGFRRDVPTLIKACAAMVLPSEQEGLPRSVMEAMCQARPVIGCRIRGMTDLLDDGRGLLVPVGDVQGLASAMTLLLDNSDEAARIGQRGRDAVGAYDLANILNMHEELYEDALGLLAPSPSRRAEKAPCLT